MTAVPAHDKLIAAFKGPAGQVVYAVFAPAQAGAAPATQQGLRVRLIGSAEQVLRFIFADGAKCEEGLALDAEGVSVTPEGHITDWLYELASPVEMVDQMVVLRVGDNCGTPIPRLGAERFLAWLRPNGFSALHSSLTQGEASTLSLHRDCEPLRLICQGLWANKGGYTLPIAPPVVGQRNRDLGYRATPAPAPRAPIPEMYRLRANYWAILLKDKQGCWRVTTACSHMERLITDLWRTELSDFGVYARIIAAHRKAMATAPLISQGESRVIIDSAVPLDRRQQYLIDRVLFFVEHQRLDAELHLGVPDDQELFHWVASMPAVCTHWVFPLGEPLAN